MTIEYTSKEEYKEAIDELNSTYVLEKILAITQNAIKWHKQKIDMGSALEEAHEADIKWCEMAAEVITERLNEINK